MTEMTTFMINEVATRASVTASDVAIYFRSGSVIIDGVVTKGTVGSVGFNSAGLPTAIISKLQSLTNRNNLKTDTSKDFTIKAFKAGVEPLEANDGVRSAHLLTS